ncbi:YedE-related selenium metabolism membrane protein [Thermanaerosceptrum fracticalcis]|uniref:YedE-related selenium metabolism membrane protein n=1 Tax=Thermanaerosceptrum fracticalcis TaxID=1712410 RepID=A0A7G6E170_THEFR|nr:YedE family putative selenium transporter [Thermanaerosceptrum fracticalcis]QNB45824.1 YedE-related selenium metabolism membrane protein [Thermanaerosceptrum fracticalcis]
MNKKILIMLTGGVVGLLGVLLVVFGNPANMGYCIACFIRDITGALGLHRAEPVQYLRPEIIGLVIGAFATALYTGEFKSVGGSNTFTRFTLSFFGMFGMLVFLGCPVRVVLRLSGGDLNAIMGLFGLIAGIGLGTYYISQGYSLGRTVSQSKTNGYIFPLFMVALLILLIANPPFIFFSNKGPGSQHAAIWLSLLAGLIVGCLAQRSRLCMIGGIRDFVFFRDTYLLSGFIAMLVVATLGNLVVGKFHLGFANQPVAHSDGLWNFLGMTLAGFSFVLLGGCPLRQLISAAEGNGDSAITVLGLMAGAAFSHNFSLAASPAGVPIGGKIAVILGLIVVSLIGGLNILKFKRIGGTLNVTSGGR